MSIAFDNATFNPNLSSFSHVVGAGANLLLIVGVKSSGIMTGTTYNGVAMTEIGHVQVGAATGEYVSLWYLVAPATGSNTVAHSGAASYTSIASSYSGAKQTGIPDASGSNSNDNLATIAKAITTVADNSWTVAIMRNLGSVSDADTGSDLTTRRGGTASSIALFDTNAAKSPAGMVNANFKARGGETGGNAFGLFVASFAPAGAGAAAGDGLLMVND